MNQIRLSKDHFNKASVDYRKKIRKAIRDAGFGNSAFRNKQVYGYSDKYFTDKSLQPAFGKFLTSLSVQFEIARYGDVIVYLPNQL